jgi:hypothetical protein
MVFLNQKSQSAKQKKECAMKKIITSIGLCMLIAGMAISAAAKGPKADGPTAQNLMAAEEALAKAFRENNADGIQSHLSDDWAVVVAFGQVEERKGTVPKWDKVWFPDPQNI